jgi:hypothetical protein
MDTRGQGDQYGCGGDTPDPPAGLTLGGPGPITRGILEPRDYYYRRLITDAVRATEAARVLPGADPDRVVVTGNSQGGGLALAVAGLVPALAAAVVTAPLMCDVRQAVSLADAGPYTELVTYLAVHRDAEERVFHTLSYVDSVLLARRACAPLHLGVGLRDNVCPPSTAYAAFDAYGETHPDRPRPGRARLPLQRATRAARPSTSAANSSGSSPSWLLSTHPRHPLHAAQGTSFYTCRTHSDACGTTFLARLGAPSARRRRGTGPARRSANVMTWCRTSTLPGGGCAASTWCRPSPPR